jgi:hypothetical protein
MRTFPLLLTTLLCVSLLAGEEALQEISWAALKAGGKLAAGEVLAKDDAIKAEPLKVENDGAAAKTITILTLDKPGITQAQYAIVGQVKYEDVAGQGCLELWSHFADGSAFFSRALAQQGPLQALSGTSGWRAFALPFDATGGAGMPSKLVLNVVLPGKGTVWLSPVKLVQGKAAFGAMAPGRQPGAWWSDSAGGYIGGIFGTLFGCLGAVIGVLATLGRARTLVLGALKASLVLGAAATLTGFIAMALGQPYEVYFTLLLLGVIAAGVAGFNIAPVRRRYEEAELRRMKALDA